MSRFIKIGILTVTAGTLSFALLLPAVSFAQTTINDPNPNPVVSPTPVSDQNPAGPAANTIDSPTKVIAVLQKITNWMFTIFIAIAAMMIIYAAFIYLTSGGGEEVSTAHKMLLYAAVAIVVATASRGLVTLTRNFIEQP